MASEGCGTYDSPGHLKVAATVTRGRRDEGHPPATQMVVKTKELPTNNAYEYENKEESETGNLKPEVRKENGLPR